MEEQEFDDLARLVAQKTSRRQVLKVLAGAALGGVFANRLSPALAANARSACAQFCNQTFGPDTDATSQCLKDAKWNPNALCNSACNGGGGTLCGGPNYNTTTCCSGSTPTCSSGVCTSTSAGCGTCVSGTCTCSNGSNPVITSNGTTTCLKPCGLGSDCQSQKCYRAFSVNLAGYCSTDTSNNQTCSADIECPVGYFCGCKTVDFYTGVCTSGACYEATC